MFPDLFPETSSFKVPSNSVFAAAILQARVDFITEIYWALRPLHHPYMGTTGTNLARSAVNIAEVESRHSTLIYCAIDEEMARRKAAQS